MMLKAADLWNGAAKNVSERRRYMLQVHYAHSAIGKWYPSIENESLWSPEVLAAVTPRQRKLLSRPYMP